MSSSARSVPEFSMVTSAAVPSLMMSAIQLEALVSSVRIFAKPAERDRETQRDTERERGQRPESAHEADD